MKSVATVANFNLLEDELSKVLGVAINAPWYVTNAQMRQELNVSTLLEKSKSKGKKNRANATTPQ